MGDHWLQLDIVLSAIFSLCVNLVYICMCTKGLQDYPQIGNFLGGLTELSVCACGYDLLQ